MRTQSLGDTPAGATAGRGQPLVEILSFAGCPNHHGAIEPGRRIETDEGARVRLEARGFARRADEASPTWAVAPTLRFECEDERYLWLDSAFGVWEGELEAELHRARYQAYLVTNGMHGKQR